MASALMWALAAGACAKSQPERDRAGDGEPAGGASAPPPRIAPEEAERGRKACDSYVEQVCNCALAKPELAAECDMARARPQALDMSLRAAMAEGNATERDRRAIHANALQIARACIEDAAALIPRGCAAPGASEPAPNARDATTPARARPSSARRKTPVGSGPVPAPPPEPEPIQDQTK